MTESSKHDLKFKEVEDDLKSGIKDVIDSQKKKKIFHKRKTTKRFKEQKAILMGLGAAAIAVIAFIVFKNKK